MSVAHIYRHTTQTYICKHKHNESTQTHDTTQSTTNHHLPFPPSNVINRYGFENHKTYTHTPHIHAHMHTHAHTYTPHRHTPIPHTDTHTHTPHTCTHPQPTYSVHAHTHTHRPTHTHKSLTICSTADTSCTNMIFPSSSPMGPWPLTRCCRSPPLANSVTMYTLWKVSMTSNRLRMLG